MNEEHVIVREPVEVMLVRVPDELPEIQRAWAEFETAVGLHGRKFYGAFDPAADTYSVCVVLRADDDPAAFGAERGTLPGGRYACVRLHGKPPEVYEQIGPTAPRAATGCRPHTADARVLPAPRRHRRPRSGRLSASRSAAQQSRIPAQSNAMRPGGLG